jgi:catechol 2,3-dioxygenase-like lactoylglutathione lyase family enzyme
MTFPGRSPNLGAGLHQGGRDMEGGVSQGTDIPAVGFVGVIHEGVPVSRSNLEASVQFYCNVLGLKLLPRPKALDDLGPGAWLGDEQGAVQFHLIAKDDELRPGPDARIAPAGRHTAWRVRDIDAFRDRLRKLGIYFEEIGSLIGQAQVFVKDPEGHTWEFQGLA